MTEGGNNERDKEKQSKGTAKRFPQQKEQEKAPDRQLGQKK